MLGQFGGVFLPGAGIILSVVLAAFQALPGSQVGIWQLLVVAFAAGGLVMQQRQITRDIKEIKDNYITKTYMVAFEERIKVTYQTKEGCDELHNGNSKGHHA